MKTTLSALTHRITIGAGELQVSPFCVGISSAATVEAAFAAGINFFFVTTDLHWPLYEGTRQGLARLCERDLRDEVVVCATAYVTQPQFCSFPFIELLDAVPGLERLDILSAGGAYARDFDGRLPTYQEHRADSFCGARAIGASFHDRTLAARAMREESLDLGFIRLNPLHPGAATDLLPFVLPSQRMKLFAFLTTHGWLAPDELRRRGLPETNWAPDITDFYRYALSHEGVDGVLCALREPAHVDALARAVAKGPLTEAECRYLEALTAGVHPRTEPRPTY